MSWLQTQRVTGTGSWLARLVIGGPVQFNSCKA